MDVTTVCIYVAGAVCTILSSAIAFFKGKGKKAETKKLTEVEQREDLRRQMVDEIKVTENQAKMFNMAMPKSEISKWKHSTVIKNLHLYALGNGYNWFDKEEWSNKIIEFVEDTKQVNAK